MVKRALCVGICYNETFAEHPGYNLPSTLPDVENFSNLLIDRFGYAPEDVRVMKDDGESEEPTRNNILQAMYEMASSANPGDHLVFYFAGHGSQDEEGTGVHDEKDYLDEAIWPSDVQIIQDDGSEIWTSVSGHILDDEVRQYLVNPAISNSAHLVVIFDCCHSGTAADLDDPSYTRVGPPSRARAFRFGTFTDPNSHAVSWGACQDPQEALGGPGSGLFTDALVDILQSCDDRATHENVVAEVRDKMAGILASRYEDMTVQEQARLQRYFEEHCQPQVEFLNDDRSLLELAVETTFVEIE